MDMKDGRILSSRVVAVNQILPHRNKWAWDLFLEGQANNWVPTEVPMAKDVEQWRSPGFLSEDERLVLRRCLGFFASGESLVSNNLLLSIFKIVGDPECRQYLLRQSYEEALHNQTIVYVCDSLSLDVADVYEAYRNVPVIKAKDDFLMAITSSACRPDYQVLPWCDEFTCDDERRRTIVNHQEALRNIITYYLVCEGMLFYAGFAMLLAFGRQNKMPGVSEQVQLTLRDEGVHVKFGTQLIQAIKAQSPELWTKEFQRETISHFETAVELEVRYARDVLPRGILGLNAEAFVDYMHYIARRRLESIGLPSPWKALRNPFPWMTEAIDLSKKKNFFETRVVEYATGNWIDDL